MFELTDSNHRCRAQFKGAQTVVGQRFAGNGPRTTWNALPYDVVNSRTLNTFKNNLDAHWEDNPPDVLVNW